MSFDSLKKAIDMNILSIGICLRAIIVYSDASPKWGGVFF